MATPVAEAGAGQITVVVPEGASPGAALRFTTPAGSTMQVHVPTGLLPGDTFVVAVPAPVAPVMATLVTPHSPGMPVAVAAAAVPSAWKAPAPPWHAPVPREPDPTSCLPAGPLVAGAVGEPLLPGLVFDRGCEFKTLEKESFEDWMDAHHDTNRYDVVEAKSLMNLLKTETEWSANMWGYRKIHVHSANRNIFNIRSTHHTWSPLAPFSRYSYRIMPPGTETLEDDRALFTINKGWSFLSTNIMSSYWYIWQGREHHGECLYTAVGNFWSTNVQIFKGCDGTYANQVGVISRQTDMAWVVGGMPDRYDVQVDPGEDSGLFLAVSVILDATADHQEAQAEAVRETRHAQRERDSQRTGQGVLFDKVFESAKDSAVNSFSAGRDP